MQMKRKQLITIEWRVAESDREWAQLCQPPAPAVKRQRGRLRWLGAALLLMVSLSGAGGWWYATQAEFKQIQAEVTAAVQQEGSVTATTWSAIDPTRPLEPEQAEADKLLITVSVTQPAGDVSPWFGTAWAYEVTSPARYRAPMEVTDAELLAQSLALPLLNTVIAQTREHYQLQAAWHPLLHGLRLWAFWDLELPLATWRPAIVTWFYQELARSAGGQAVVLPARYAELCAAHRLWLPSPLQLGIPLACTALDQQAGYFAATSGRKLALHLTDLGASPARADAKTSMQGIDPRGQTVALATLIDYGVTAYGRERLPVLVAALPEHQPFPRLSSLQTLALTHFRDDRRRLQDAGGQFGLAQAMFAVQVLGDEIAKRVAHFFTLDYSSCAGC